MSSVTIRLELKKQPTSLGKYPIYIRITKDRKIKRSKTSVELDRKSDWNPKSQKIRSSNPDYEILNDLLKKEVDEVLSIYGEDKSASLATLQNKVKHKDDSSSLLAYAQDFTDTLKANARANAKHYQTLCNMLKAFLDESHKGDVNLNEVTPAFVKHFYTFLQTQHNQRYVLESPDKRLHPNYIRTLLVKLRAILNDAIRCDKMKPEDYPFARSKEDVAKFKIPKVEDSNKVALDDKGINAIIALDLEKDSMLWHTRNAFLFSYFCAGIRAGDLLTLRWNNVENGVLKYKMHKTSSERILIIPDQATAILDLYRGDQPKTHFVFPFMDSDAQWAKYKGNIDTMPVTFKKQMFDSIYSKNAMMNKDLKVIASKANISENVSFHVSRHTFASLAVKKGVSTKIVQEMLGHASLATTQTYLHSFGDKEITEAMSLIFGSKEDELLAALKRLSPEARAAMLEKLNASK